METPSRKALLSVGANSLNGRANSSVQRALDDRLTLSEAIDAATTIIGHYPHSQNVGDSYIGALAANLGRFPKSIALQCTDAAEGVAKECKFLPTVADVVTWCDKRTGPLRVQVDRAERVVKQLADRAEFEHEQTTVRARHMTVLELKERYGDWHARWHPLGQRARELADAGRAALVEQIGEDAFDALPVAAQ